MKRKLSTVLATASLTMVGVLGMFGLQASPANASAGVASVGVASVGVTSDYSQCVPNGLLPYCVVVDVGDSPTDDKCVTAGVDQVWRLCVGIDSDEGNGSHRQCVWIDRDGQWWFLRCEDAGGHGSDRLCVSTGPWSQYCVGYEGTKVCYGPEDLINSYYECYEVVPLPRPAA